MSTKGTVVIPHEAEVVWHDTGLIEVEGWYARTLGKWRAFAERGATNTSRAVAASVVAWAESIERTKRDELIDLIGNLPHNAKAPAIADAVLAAGWSK